MRGGPRLASESRRHEVALDHWRMIEKCRSPTSQKLADNTARFSSRMAELAGLDAGIRDTPESADGASGAESGLADPMIEVRLPTSPAHSRQKAPRVGLEKVPDTGGQRTLLCCWTTRFFCPMPQDICLSRSPRTPDCPIHARARPRLPATQSMHLLPPRHVGGAEMPNDIFQNRLSRAGMCCPRRCSP